MNGDEIVYNLLGEIEKEVIVASPTTPPISSTQDYPMESEIIKTIWKTEVQVLCAQHNPVGEPFP